MVAPFEHKPGVLQVLSGYTGGHTEDPTYEEVCYEDTGHYEAVQITFDPNLIKYEKLLDIYWQQIDPTDTEGQFFDRSPSYRTVIFYHNDEQKRMAEASKQTLVESRRFRQPIVTQILPAAKFYPAEAYHQNYHQKNPVHYKAYRQESGRDAFIRKYWTKDEREEAKKKLTPLQLKVTQNKGTELPFQNEYWDNKQPGLYVDIISGEPLFSSLDKFDSGCGWPSFSSPLDTNNIKEKKDYSH